MQDEAWKVICDSLERVLTQLPELGMEMEREKISKANISPNATVSYMCPCPGAVSAVKLQTQGTHPVTSDIYLIPPTHPTSYLWPSQRNFHYLRAGRLVPCHPGQVTSPRTALSDSPHLKEDFLARS